MKKELTMAKPRNNYDEIVEGDSGNEIFSQTSMSEESTSDDEVFTVTQVRKSYSKTTTTKRSTPRSSRFGPERQQKPKPTPSRKDKNRTSKPSTTSKMNNKTKKKQEEANIPSSSYGFRSMAKDSKRKVRPVSSSSDDDYQRQPSRSSTPKKKQPRPSYSNVLYF